MSDPIKTSRDPDIWQWATQFGFGDIDTGNVFRVVQNSRRAVIRRLQELLSQGAQNSECQSAASAIGTLTELERRVGGEDEGAPREGSNSE
jgi:hypothetical protein